MLARGAVSRWGARGPRDRLGQCQGAQRWQTLCPSLRAPPPAGSDKAPAWAVPALCPLGVQPGPARGHQHPLLAALAPHMPSQGFRASPGTLGLALPCLWALASAQLLPWVRPTSLQDRSCRCINTSLDTAPLVPCSIEMSPECPGVGCIWQAHNPGGPGAEIPLWTGCQLQRGGVKECFWGIRVGGGR